MNRIQIYQTPTTFRALVPKKAYSGTPKLKKECIEQINKLKSEILQNDKDILELENQVEKADKNSVVEQYLKLKLSILNKFRSMLNSEIDCIRRYDEFNCKDLYKVKKEKSEKIEKLETDFEKHPSFLELDSFYNSI